MTDRETLDRARMLFVGDTQGDTHRSGGDCDGAVGHYYPADVKALRQPGRWTPDLHG